MKRMNACRKGNAKKSKEYVVRDKLVSEPKVLISNQTCLVVREIVRNWIIQSLLCFTTWINHLQWIITLTLVA